MYDATRLTEHYRRRVPLVDHTDATPPNIGAPTVAVNPDARTDLTDADGGFRALEPGSVSVRTPTAVLDRIPVGVFRAGDRFPSRFSPLRSPVGSMTKTLGLRRGVAYTGSMDEDEQVMTEEQYDSLTETLSGHEQSERGGRTIYANPGLDCPNPRCPYGEFDAVIETDIGWMEFAAREAIALCMCEVETDEGRRKLIFMHELETPQAAGEDA
jgi:hypothetical protein